MKVPTGVSRIEQETFFRINADDREWDFYSRDPKFKRLLERRGYTVTEDHQGFWSAKIPIKALSLRSQKSLNITSDLREKRRLWAKALHPDQEKNISERPDEVLPVPEIGA